MQHVSFRLDRVNTLERHRSPAAFNRLGLSKARTLGSGTPSVCSKGERSGAGAAAAPLILVSIEGGRRVQRQLRAAAYNLVAEHQSNLGRGPWVREKPAGIPLPESP